uniref:Uncharacterized protein n=1 Tax=Helicotheca tamesis TaxID=374047 RepID=A0A7S2HZM4_9STRA
MTSVAAHSSSDLPRPYPPGQSLAPTPRPFPAQARTTLARKVGYREEHVQTAGTLHTCASSSDSEEATAAPSRNICRGGSEGLAIPSSRSAALAPTRRVRAHTCSSCGDSSSDREDFARHYPTSPSRSRRIINMETDNTTANIRTPSTAANATTSSSTNVDSNPSHTHAPLHDSRRRSANRLTPAPSTATSFRDSFASLGRMFEAFTVSLGRQRDCVTSPRRRAMRVAACIMLYFVAMTTFLYPTIPREFTPHPESPERSRSLSKNNAAEFVKKRKDAEEAEGPAFGVSHGREVKIPLGATDDSGSHDSASSKEIKKFVLRGQDEDETKKKEANPRTRMANGASGSDGGSDNMNTPNTVGLKGPDVSLPKQQKARGHRPSLLHAKYSSNEVMFGAIPREVRLVTDGSGRNGGSTSSKKRTLKRFVPPEDDAEYIISHSKLESGRRGWWQTIRGLFIAIAWVGLIMLVLETGCREVVRRFMYVQHRRRRARTE